MVIMGSVSDALIIVVSQLTFFVFGWLFGVFDANSKYFYWKLVIYSMLFIVLSLKLRRKQRCVLLVGLSDSGKTALYMRLIANRHINTVTSLKENQTTIGDETNNGKQGVRLIDLPGNDRLRAKYWEEFRGQGSMLIFVLDSVTLRTRLREVSDFLYAVLADRIVQSRNVPVVVACNKCDQPGALDTDTVRELLTRELNAIRATTKGQLDKTSNTRDDDTLRFIGDPTKEFEFNDKKVTFVACSVDDVDKLRKLIM